MIRPSLVSRHDFANSTTELRENNYGFRSVTWN